jgi:hypothetical protein
MLREVERELRVRSRVETLVSVDCRSALFGGVRWPLLQICDSGYSCAVWGSGCAMMSVY